MPTSSRVNPRSANGSLTTELRSYLSQANSAEDALHIQLHGTGAVAELESKLRDLYQMRFALSVANCTSGLLAAALALDLRNQEVLVPPIMYGASVSGLLLLGNRLRFCDVDPQTLTLSPEAVRRSITSKTRAILAVDIFGVPCDSTAIRELADQHGLAYISDCAQSLGAKRQGLPAGSLADALVVSFTTGKTLFAGEGGAILTNSEKLYQKLIWCTQHPYRQKRELGLHISNEFGLNARIHPAAAIWANAAFRLSLQRLRRHQARCFRLIDSLNALNMTESIPFRTMSIEPTFFRLTAARRYNWRQAAFGRDLQKLGLKIEVDPFPVSLVYRHSSFQAQYSQQASGVERCVAADEQARQRIGIRFLGR